VLLDARPLAVLLPPDKDLAVIRARGQNAAKLGVGPRDLPDWTLMSREFKLCDLRESDQKKKVCSWLPIGVALFP